MPETLVVVPLPEMGESVTEGSIVEWHVRAGQWIDEGATLVDVTTDKVDVEVPAPASGVVTKVLADEGATIAVGATLVEIDTSAAKPDGASAPAPVLEPPTPSSYGAQGDAPVAAPKPPATAKPGGVASHRAQRLAARTHLDLSSVVGSGPGGLILHDDVLKAEATWSEHAAHAGSNGAKNGAPAAPAAPQPPL
ncbi:MAG: E3 binding domain-containing protein, partial [Candidatus Eremiobacteraeota bacterium]|nr:E3 binding domain-containing protein [Candidatus Eremiobacteraeota bacterium]